MATEKKSLDQIFKCKTTGQIIEMVPKRNHSEFNASLNDGNYREAVNISLDQLQEAAKDQNNKVKLALAKAMLDQVCQVEIDILNDFIKKGDLGSDLSDLTSDLDRVVFSSFNDLVMKDLRIKILSTLAEYFLSKHTNTEPIQEALPYLVQLVEMGEIKYRQIIFDIISEFPGRVYDQDKLKNSNYTQLISNGYSLLREGDKRGLEYLSEGMLDKLTEYLDMHKSDTDPKLDFVEELIFKMKSWGIELFLEQELDYEVLKCRKNKMTEIQTQAALKRLICEIATKLLDMNSGHFRSSNIINASRLLKLAPKYKITDISELEKLVETCRIAYSRTAKH